MHTVAAPFSVTALRDVIRDAVDRSGRSKQEIAHRAGISRRALYSLLEGEADPRLSTLEALAHVLELVLTATPRVAGAAPLAALPSAQMSGHSRVRRLLAREGGD